MKAKKANNTSPSEYYKNFSLENMEGEIWVNIPKYEGKYMASNFGRIKSLSRTVWGICRWGHLTPRKRKERIVSQCFCKGYLLVGLYDGNTENKKAFGKNKGLENKKVHRIILESFFGFSDLQVNHKNFIVTDNRLENLEYLSPRENVIHYHKTRRSMSKYMGVSPFKDFFVSKIHSNGTPYVLGYFGDEKEAGDAYLEAKEKLKDPLFNPELLRTIFRNKIKYPSIRMRLKKYIQS